MGTCDICGNAYPLGDMEPVPADRIGALSRRGFVPRYLPQAMTDMASDDRPLEALWKMTVAVNNTDWGLCPSCAGEVRGFDAATRKPGNARNAADQHAEAKPATGAGDGVAAFFGGILLGFVVAFVLVYAIGTIVAPLTRALDLGDIYSWSGFRMILLGALCCGVVIGIIVAIPDGATVTALPGGAIVTVIVAFFLQPRDTLGGQATSLTDLSGNDQWKDRLREELGLPDADVRLFTEEQWQMPHIDSYSDIYDQNSLVEITGSIAATFVEQHVEKGVVEKFIHSDLENLLLPTSGRIILFQSISAPRDQLGQLV